MALLPDIKDADSRKANFSVCLWFLPFRTVLLFFGQGLVYCYYLLAGQSSPWLLAGKWWSVWGNFSDLGCLLVLIILLRREGLVLSDLFKPVTKKVLRSGLLFLMITAPFSALGSVLASWIAYGNWHADLLPGALYGRHLPLWGILYSFFIWAPIWSVTEEMTYNGYLAGRIEQYTNRRWLTLLLVCFWWALQHIFLPFIPNWHYFAWRFISFVPCVLALVIIYLKRRNLGGLVIAHLIMDMGAVAATIAY